MIVLQNATLLRGGRTLFEDATLSVHAGHKVGITGANGSGKSSLFALLLGGLHLDAGQLELPARWQVASVAQETPSGERPAVEFVMDGDAELRHIQAQIEAAQNAHAGEKLSHLLARLEAIDGYTARSRAARLLHGLGFSAQQEQRPVRHFSGGWRMRLNLARALMCRSDLLLLDEPTNHLDLDAVLWLEQWLRDYAGTLLLISHDRDFLDNCAEFIASIEDGTVRLYAGNYAQFERQQAERIARETALAIKQQREVAHVRAFVDRFRAKATKARQVQSRLKALARLETVAASRTDSPFHFTFADPGGSSNPLLEIEEGCFGYGDTTVLEGVRVSLAPGDRVGLLGRNGAGKSTLIRAIAGVMQPKHGRRRPARGLRVGYFAQHQLEQLDPGADALVHLRRLAPQEREQTLREFLGGFGLSGEDALRPLTTFSGGERARLALALLVWRRPHLLLLDEPTNHLDLRMRDALTLALQDYPGAMVLVSHDRHLLRATSDRLLLVDNSAVNAFDGDLDDYRTWLLRGTSEVREHAGRDPVRQSRREQRRRDAEARTQRRPLLDRLRRAEKLLAELDTKRQAIQQVLADSGIYDAGRKRELQDTLLEQGALGQQIERAEEDWLQLSEALETLDRAARGNTGD